jgi:hypothetical protein
METNQLYRLLIANDSELLKGYANYEYTISDLQKVTQYPYKAVHNILYNEFPSYVESRMAYKDEMYKMIEHFIDLGIPIDIFREDVPMIRHIQQVKSLRRTIQRMINSDKINPSVSPVTMSRFKNLVQRVEIKRALVENIRSTQPIAVKNIAEQLDVSQSLVFKINRSLDEIDPEMNTQGQNPSYDKTEQLYEVFENYEHGRSKEDIMNTYDISNQDMLIIIKTFKLMNEY